MESVESVSGLSVRETMDLERSSGVMELVDFFMVVEREKPLFIYSSGVGY